MRGFLLLLVCWVGAATAQFDASVVMLNKDNWKDMLASPHGWMLNVCRAGWGYCTQLQPEYQKLGRKMKGTVKVAYWDTAQGNPPRLVGEIRGTPTVKFIRPGKKNKKDSNKKKTVLDFQGERKLDAMKSFVESQMPSYVSRVNGMKDLAKFVEKADGYTLPKALVVTKETSTSPITKALSTEFRRRLLLAEVRASKPNAEVISKLGLDDWLKASGGEKTVVVTLKGGGMDGGHSLMSKDGAPAKFTWRAASFYLSSAALSVPYYETEAYLAKQPAEEAEQPKADGGKTEL